MRVPIEWRSSSRGQYDDFCKTNKSISLTFEEWKEIIYGFNYDLRDYILTYGDKVKIPFGFGYLTISKRKTKKYKTVDGVQKIILPIDWKKTKEKGKRIYNFNYHTEGFRFKWVWFPKSARFKCSKLWIFKPSRTSSRKITEFLNNKEGDFQNVYREWTT